jgi:hypothetical protein
MLPRTIARSALSALCALSFACSTDDAPAGPAATGASGSSGVALSLFGRGGAGQGCRAPEYREFDFWIGSWQVPTGGVPSADFITSGLDGCAIFEDWHGAGGFHGRSMSAFDASDGQWHQHWVDDHGFFPLYLTGGFEAGSMVMEDSYLNPRTGVELITSRYTWTAPSADDVEQLIETSVDGGPFTGGALSYHRTANPSVPPSPDPGICTFPPFDFFREFDFTVGQWTVETDGPGQSDVEFSAHHPVQSEITPELSGCLYEEKLTGFQGYEARVFTNIRPIDEIWRRTYVDNRGLRVFLSGPRIQEGTITLTGTMPRNGGKTDQVRVTFEPTDATHFTERWERAKSNGGWEELVAARYSKE